MLNTCESHDDSVVIYDMRNCPFCVMAEEKDRLEKEVDELKDEIKSLEKADGV
jgi:glutaredoxin